MIFAGLGQVFLQKSGVPRVDELHAQSRKILDVARHQYQIVMQGGRCQQAIDDRQATTGAGLHPTPSISHLLIDTEQSTITIRQRRKQWDDGVGYEEREIFELFLKLPVPQRKLARELIVALAKANGVLPL